jgi:hypothetical protein
MWSATIDVKLLASRCFKAEAEINNFDVLSYWVDEYVVKFEVSVHVALLVHVGDTLCDLAEDFFALLFR